MNDIYLELPREINDARELGIILTIIGFICILYFIGTAVTYVKLSELDLISVVIGIIAIPCMAGLLYYNWRVHIEAPADLPIRFNRMRRKVYAYNFQSNAFRFWSRKGWGVTHVVYDWDNLRAEFYSAYGPMGTGGLVENIYLAVVEPNTGKIIDRFHFAHGEYRGKTLWALACLYMQQGPNALPDFGNALSESGNQYQFKNIPNRFGPKVRWPEAMDIESRSAPTPGETPQ